MIQRPLAGGKSSEKDTTDTNLEGWPQVNKKGLSDSGSNPKKDYGSRGSHMEIRSNAKTLPPEKSEECRSIGHQKSGKGSTDRNLSTNGKEFCALVPTQARHPKPPKYPL